MLLKLTAVTKVFSTAKAVVALDDVSLQVDEGEFVLLAGPNGSGKSVLMSIIAGLDSATSGEVWTKNDTRVALIFQDANAQILGESVKEDVAFGARNIGLKGKALQDAIKDSLSAVGLLTKIDDDARTLSGGQKRRLAVASALVMNAKLLIFDEPFSNLDYGGVVSVCALLKQLKEEGKTIIILTHEIEKIAAIATRFIILYNGKVSFDGKVQDALNDDLTKWGIRNPLCSYKNIEDLFWR